MRSDQKKEEQIFTAAIEIESRIERDAYIAKSWGENQRLLASVQMLL